MSTSNSASRPRILHLISTLERAGAQSVVLGLAATIEHFEVTVAYLWGQGEATRDLEGSVDIVDLSRSGRPDPWILPRLTRWMRRDRFDLVHTHLVHAGIAGKVAARAQGIPTVATRHYAIHRKSDHPLYRMEARLNRSAERVVAVSEAVRAELLADGVDPRKIALILNGIDLAEFPPKKLPKKDFPPEDFPREESSPAEFPAPGSPHSVDGTSAEGMESVEASTGGRGGNSHAETVFRIGSIGRLDPHKGFDVLIRAVAELSAQETKVELEIVGEGAGEEELRTLAQFLGVADRVHFLGTHDRRELVQRLHSWDAFALASRSEAFGVVLLEAMAAELPVVCTGVGGTGEAVGDQAIIVPPESPAALARGLRRLMDNPEEAARLARGGRARVLEHFSIAKAAAAHAELYRDLLSPRR